MSSSKKIDLCMDSAAGVYLAQNPIPPPTHDVDVYTPSSILIHTVKGGEGESDETERRLDGQQFTKLG